MAVPEEVACNVANSRRVCATKLVRLLTGVLFCLAISGLTNAPSAAQTAPAGGAAAAADYCPVHLRVYALKDLADELAFALWADDGGATASGSIVAFVNGGRYTIPFSGAVIPDERDAKAVPTPIVVKFVAPANFESAYVGSIEGSPCAIHSPFFRKPLTRSGLDDVAKTPLYPSRDWNAYLSNAALLPPLRAPAPDPQDKPACKQLYAEPTASAIQQPALPPHEKEFFGGSIIVRIALGADGKATALRLDKPAPNKDYDHSALIAAAQSKFTPEIFRCQAVSSDFYFDANFDPHTTVDMLYRDQPEPNVKGAHNK
jgi:hypothetical protein